MRCFIARFTIIFLNFIHVALIALNFGGILISKDDLQALYFCFLGILWAILWANLDNTSVIKWANSVIKNEGKK